MNWKKTFLGGSAAALAGIVVLLLPIDIGLHSASMTEGMRKAERLDLSAYDAGPPRRPLNLLFIHHSTGGQLLADVGPEMGTNCIYTTTPNGGGLRSRLEKNSYVVHELSYASRLGDKTDLFDWLPKFRFDMDQILVTDHQDKTYTDGRTNQVVLFKSCFPNSWFDSKGEPPGNPVGPKMTVWNAKASYTELLKEFEKRPEVLFVCFTAPPLIYHPPPIWRQVYNKVRGRENRALAAANFAREFNTWLADRNGWLKDYTLTNVVVFDYYDILTGEGESNSAVYPSGPKDDHPNGDGQKKAAEAFVPLVNRAARRAGLTL